MYINGETQIQNTGITLNDLTNINSTFTTINFSGMSVTTEQTKTLISTTIVNAGIYLIEAMIPINYYGQSSRDLQIRLKINGTNKIVSSGVIHTYAWTLDRTFIDIENIPANSTLVLEVYSSTASNWLVSAFSLKFLRLK